MKFFGLSALLQAAVFFYDKSICIALPQTLRVLPNMCFTVMNEQRWKSFFSDF